MTVHREQEGNVGFSTMDPVAMRGASAFKQSGDLFAHDSVRWVHVWPQGGLLPVTHLRFTGVSQVELDAAWTIPPEPLTVTAIWVRVLELTTVWTVLAANTTSHAFTGLTADTRYTVQVRVVHTGGDGTVFSPIAGISGTTLHTVTAPSPITSATWTIPPAPPDVSTPGATTPGPVNGGCHTTWWHWTLFDFTAATVLAEGDASGLGAILVIGSFIVDATHVHEMCYHTVTDDCHGNLVAGPDTCTFLNYVAPLCSSIPTEWARAQLALATRLEPCPIIADPDGLNYYGVSVLGDGAPSVGQYAQLTGGTTPVFTDNQVHSSAHIVKHGFSGVDYQTGVVFGEQVAAAVSGDINGAGTECYVLDVARKANGNIMVMLRVRQYDGRGAPAYTGMAWPIGATFSPPNSTAPGTYRWVEDTPGAATQFVAIVELLPSLQLYDIVTVDKLNATVRATWGKFQVVRSTEAGGSYPTDRVNIFIAWDNVADGLMRIGEGTSTNLKTRRFFGGAVGPYSLLYYENDYDGTGAAVGIDYCPTGLTAGAWTVHDVIWDSLLTLHIAMAVSPGATAPFIGSVGNFLNTSTGIQEWVYQAFKIDGGFPRRILGMRSNTSTHSVSNNPPGYAGDGIKQCFTMVNGVLVAKYDYEKPASDTNVGSVSSVVAGVLGTTTISFPAAWQRTSLAVQISSTRVGELAVRPSPIVPADRTQPPLYVFGNAGWVNGLIAFLYTYDPVLASEGMTKWDGSVWTNECQLLVCPPFTAALSQYLTTWRSREVDIHSVPNVKDDALIGVQTYAPNQVIHGSPPDITTAVTLVDAMTHLVTVLE